MTSKPLNGVKDIKEMVLKYLGLYPVKVTIAIAMLTFHDDHQYIVSNEALQF